MPLNKDFTLRIEILDECLRRRQKKWFVDVLLDEINAKLNDRYEKNISKRTLQYDLDYLINDLQAPVVKYKDGQKVYYTYDDPNYSIKNLPVNEEEVGYLKDVIHILKQVSNFSIIGDVESIVSKLEHTINTNVIETRSLVQFEKSSNTISASYFDNIFSAIKGKTALRITYQPFNKREMEWLVHPYLLKEYRNRWFLICRIGKQVYASNLALDRIKKISNSAAEFLPNDLFEPDTFYNNLIGVSLPAGKEPEEIHIKINKNQAPYVVTKPIHDSQQTTKMYKNGSIAISLRLVVNYELRSILLSYGEGIEVLKPSSLREEMKGVINTMQKNYL